MSSNKKTTIYAKYNPKELSVLQKSYNPSKVKMPKTLASIKANIDVIYIPECPTS